MFDQINRTYISLSRASDIGITSVFFKVYQQNSRLELRLDYNLVIHLQGSHFVQTVHKTSICKVKVILCMLSYYFDA